MLTRELNLTHRTQRFVLPPICHVATHTVREWRAAYASQKKAKNTVRTSHQGGGENDREHTRVADSEVCPTLVTCPRVSDTPSWLTGMIVTTWVADSGRAAPTTRVRAGGRRIFRRAAGDFLVKGGAKMVIFL